MAFLEFFNILLFLGLFYAIFCLIVGLYNVTFHPLAKTPGPRLRGTFYFPTYWGKLFKKCDKLANQTGFTEIWTGDGVANPKKLHDLYGNTVRISPATVSFNNSEAWQEIYGQHHGKKPIPKDKDVYFSGNDGVADIISSNDVEHARIRRALSHAFSEASLREQEPLMNVYFDLLTQKLYEQIDSPSNDKVNIVRFFNFTTFDLIGDLCFAESFDALRTQEYNSWIANIFKGLKFARLFRVMRAYPLLGIPILAMLALFSALQKARHRHIQYTQDKTARRLDTVTDRSDFMSYILRHNDEKGMTRASDKLGVVQPFSVGPRNYLG
ncbi:uncharacterized protein EAE97_005727 [Botrytis byssoidea]|uniref:Cytochrome P450 n=1 Tax=Botrytis byssoidea TaxID=139641 RepID=A0A9P5ILM2_9HELO|nr:uncharacterized protein EAE97_005727 [Botrytis byssoidea]KAF7943656.1 hypothetical protein EAE97_005727 [Botrytis byssoidea]